MQKKWLGQKIILLVVVSLLLANLYVERGKDVKASETEQMTERLSESITESESETESESITESESETESESITEAESETESEGVTESESELESEDITESEGEPESEVTTESESESESEVITESEGESEREVTTESEIETEKLIRTVRISQIAAKLPEEGRIYDGTNQIELSYVIEGLENETEITVCYEAHLEGVDVGEWPVEYEFWLEKEGKELVLSENVETHQPEGQEVHQPEDQEQKQSESQDQDYQKSQVEYQLEIEAKSLAVSIQPRPLTVLIPDGWKTYGKEALMEQIHLLGEVKVKGFLKDEEGKEIIPKDFEAPEVDVDTSIVEKWSDIYQKGKQKIYENALVMRKDKKGNILGNATKNYVFSEDEEKEQYQKGNLVIAQADILPGVDFQIQGEAEAWHQTGDGILWVRQGTGLQMVPLADRGYNQGMNTGVLTQGGSFSFSLKKVNKKGQIVADSLERWIAYQVDGSVPEALIEVSGTKEMQGSYYGKGQVYVQIHIPQDNGSGMKKARYFMAVTDTDIPTEIPAVTEWWQDCTNGIQLQLAQQGTYIIYVETEDYTGNKAYVKSAPIVIDTQKPEIQISGVENNSANRGNIEIVLESSDKNYREGSLKVHISGANGAGIPAQKEYRKTENGEQISFQDFTYEKQSDDIYTLTATAEDLAGNKTEKKVVFSVNRFGSVYDLSPETKRQLTELYHTTAFPITFLETNIDYVGTVKIICKQEGQTRELVEGKEYFVTYSGNDSGWKQYQYQIPASVFAQEGSYEVMMVSRDRAENSGDSLTQKKNVEFIIDQTAPECLITGVGTGKIYEADEIWISIMPRDNIQMKKIQIFLDGKVCASYSSLEIEEQNGVIKWKLQSADYWQRLQVKLTDAAGNQSWTEEIPVYIAGKNKGEIPAYVKSQKSAKELEEEKLPFKLLQILFKKEYVMGKQMVENRKEDVIVKTGKYRGIGKPIEQKMAEGKNEAVENAVEQKGKGMLEAVLPYRLVFYVAGTFILAFLFLTASIPYIKRKR